VNEISMVDRLPRLNAKMHDRGTQSRSRDQGLMTSVTGTKDNALDGNAPSYTLCIEWSKVWLGNKIGSDSLTTRRFRRWNHGLGASRPIRVCA